MLIEDLKPGTRLRHVKAEGRGRPWVVQRVYPDRVAMVRGNGARVEAINYVTANYVVVEESTDNG